MVLVLTAYVQKSPLNTNAGADPGFLERGIICIKALGGGGGGGGGMRY